MLNKRNYGREERRQKQKQIPNGKLLSHKGNLYQVENNGAAENVGSIGQPFENKLTPNLTPQIKVIPRGRLKILKFNHNGKFQDF